MLALLSAAPACHSAAMQSHSEAIPTHPLKINAGAWHILLPCSFHWEVEDISTDSEDITLSYTHDSFGETDWIYSC